MTEYLIISLAAVFGSTLTFFSGFGLGTMLVPIFAIFFPIEMAIVLTAVVHFLNNIFKILLVGKSINFGVLFRFGIPAFIFAFLGAELLTYFAKIQPIASYSIAENNFQIIPVKLIIAILLAIFSMMDFLPFFSNLNFDKKYLPFGGVLSGFFGGLSGNQGALRTAFLIRANLTKEQFIATSIGIALLIDISRLSVYSSQFFSLNTNLDYKLLVFATLSAFFGAFMGKKLLKKITIKTLQQIVGIVLLIFSILLGMGIV